MNIRPATKSDVPDITRIVASAYAKYIPRIGKPPGPMLDDYAAHVRNHAIWVSDNEAGISGILVLIPMDGHLLLDNIAVDPVCHGQGIGRALLSFADQEALRRGYSELRLYTHETMTENLALYPALGWEETGRAEQSGYDRVFFRKAVQA